MTSHAFCVDLYVETNCNISKNDEIIFEWRFVDYLVQYVMKYVKILNENKGVLLNTRKRDKFIGDTGDPKVSSLDGN